MIVRILGEGQLDVPDDQLDRLNELDAQVETAVETGDESRFADSLRALLDGVRSAGVPLPDDSLEESDLVLPPADASLERSGSCSATRGSSPVTGLTPRSARRKPGACATRSPDMAHSRFVPDTG